MSAVVEINIFSRRPILPEEIFSRIEKNSYSVSVNNIQSMDDWQYNGFEEHGKSLEQLDITNLITMEKIVKVDFSVSRNICGYTLSKVSDIVYETMLWINTELHPELDCDYVCDKSQDFYEVLDTELTEVVTKNKMVAIGMGVETKIDYQTDCQRIIDNSRNILKWIFPSEIKVKLPDDFSLYEKNCNKYYSKMKS